MYCIIVFNQIPNINGVTTYFAFFVCVFIVYFNR